MVEQEAVNFEVAGSSPASRANKKYQFFDWCFLFSGVAPESRQPAELCSGKVAGSVVKLARRSLLRERTRTCAVRPPEPLFKPFKAESSG